MNKNIVIILVIIIIIIVGYWLWQSTTKPVKEEPTNGEINPLRIEENAIYAPDQKPGSEVVIGLATFKDGGYVVVHEESEGKPGSIVGTTTLLDAGSHNNIDVTLSRPSVNGEGLFAMLHKDNGDGTFNAADDTPINGSDGNVIMMRFLIDGGADAPGAVTF